LTIRCAYNVGFSYSSGGSSVNLTGPPDLNLANPGDPVTITNLPYDSSGNLIDSRSRPRGAGFGVANAYQAPRSVQVQVRFSF